MFPRPAAVRAACPLIGSFPKKSRSCCGHGRCGRGLARGRHGVPPGLALPYPGHRRRGRADGRLVLTVAPVTTPALFVMCGPAGLADHGAIMGGPGKSALGSPLGGVGAAHPAAPFGGPLLLIQAAPGAVLLRPRNGVSEAFRADRARGTYRLGLAFPHFTLGLALSVRPEEEHDVLASARAGVLPGPARPWRHGHLPTYLRHESVSSFSLCS